MENLANDNFDYGKLIKGRILQMANFATGEFRIWQILQVANLAAGELSN